MSRSNLSSDKPSVLAYAHFIRTNKLAQAPSCIAPPRGDRAREAGLWSSAKARLESGQPLPMCVDNS